MYNNKSVLNNKWFLKNFDERKVLYISQKYNLSYFLSKLIFYINLTDEEIEEFINPVINNFPNPFKLKDMNKSVNRSIEAINKKEKIGILADYDVDGSTSAAILFNFLKSINLDISVKVPNRLTEGYGPNERIMNEFLKEKISLLYVLDCGTTSFKVLNNSKYSSLDIIVIDHHISDRTFPEIYSLINPNRYDENNDYVDLAAVGVTFLFLLALRKKLRESNFFKKNNEPNLLNYLDLVAIGTVCDVVRLTKFNRSIVSKGLEIIKLRKSKSISTILDKAKLKSSPNVNELGFLIGPQINAASRLGESFLPFKLLISSNINEIDSISRKLILLNEKRKLVENLIFEQAESQIKTHQKSKYILISNDNWHRGVLGIVANRILTKYNKPTIIISFENNIGVGSGRSIDNINLGEIIMEAKKNGLLINGGGHKVAAGLKIDKNKLDVFNNYLKETFDNYDIKFFEKKSLHSDKISLDQIQPSIINDLLKLEPFGKGNEEPNFIFTDINIESIKILKDKHILVIFKNNINKKIKGISFNSINTVLGDHLLKYKHYNFEISGILKEDKYSGNYEPQIIIKDLMLLN